MFNIILLIHIIAGSMCLLLGLLAGFARKLKGLHTIAGEFYHGFYVVVFLTSVTMAILHWKDSSYLLYIGLFSYSLAITGYIAAKRKRRGWLRLHIGTILGSYIAIITAVLVVNASHMPVVQDWPVLVVWFFPTIIGTPIITLIGRKYISAKKVPVSK